jgi:uncharacterized protein DUF3987
MVAAKQLPDLGKERGLSPDTLKLFNVRNNATGWEYDTRTMDGGKATRWKSYTSTCPDGVDPEKWRKYLWKPTKPDGAKYFYPPELSLQQAIHEAGDILYMVGGDIAAMSMFEAGYRNITCTFGDSVPDSLLEDLKAWNVELLYIIPDRDESGQKWAVRIRDLLLDQLDVHLFVYQLPYSLEKNHGKDVNDYWREVKDGLEFQVKLDQLDEWRLPEPEPRQVAIPSAFTDETEIPELLKSEIRRQLGVTERYNGAGWSRKNVKCPFHDDKQPSATWNDEKCILHCHAGCGKDYLVRDLCEKFGLDMGDYYRSAPTTQLKKNLPTITVKSPIDFPAQPQVYRHAPRLSEDARLTNEQFEQAQHGRGWLNEYIKWAKESAPLSPDIFYEAMGMWTLALAATRRMKVQIGGENIFPNLYIFIVAPTTVYRKSTALNIASQILDLTHLDALLLPERATPEALFEYLAGRTPSNHESLSDQERNHWQMGRTFAAQRAIMEDEASGLLSEMKKDYMNGLSELLLKGYDGQGTLRKLLKSQGLITLRDMCLSFLGATTPIEWSRRMGQEEKQNGFLARFAIITPENPPVYQDVMEDVSPPTAIVDRIRHMFTKVLSWDERCYGQDGKIRALPLDAQVTSPPLTTLSIAPAAFEQFRKYRRAMSFTMLKAGGLGGEVEEDKSGSYARLGTMMIKVAMLLAAVDSDHAPIRIEAKHAYAAQLLCERWRESLHRLDSHVAESRYNGIDEKVLQFVKTGGELGVTAREIHRACNLSYEDVQKNLKTLMDSGSVDMFKREGKGRPAICYKVVA